MVSPPWWICTSVTSPRESTSWPSTNPCFPAVAMLSKRSARAIEPAKNTNQQNNCYWVECAGCRAGTHRRGNCALVIETAANLRMVISSVRPRTHRCIQVARGKAL